MFKTEKQLNISCSYVINVGRLFQIESLKRKMFLFSS